MDFLNKQFEYIESCISPRGVIVDKNLNCPLNFQYHYASYILSCVLLNKRENIDIVLDYFFGIEKEKMIPSNEFNVVLLLLALKYDENDVILRYKDKILNYIYHAKDSSFDKRNNNFRALRLVGMVLEKDIKNETITDKIQAEIEWLSNLQFDDGFYPDSNPNYEVVKNEGVPHLTYHAKITMCVGLLAFMTSDKSLLLSFERALSVLVDVSSEDCFLFYGRSTNAIFGYASLFTSLVLYTRYNRKTHYIKLANKIAQFIKRYQHLDGHISINLNHDDSDRPGYDSYMYDIVYNSYSNAIFNLGRKFLSELDISFRDDFDDVSKAENYTKIYDNSGFVVYHNNGRKVCFNYKGHADSLKHRFDPRVSALSLLYYTKNSEHFLPAVIYPPQPVLRLVEKEFPFLYMKAKIFKLYNFDYLPILSGNTFFYKKKGVNFYIYRFVRKFHINGRFIVKYEMRSRRLLGEGGQRDFCIVSIDLQKLKYKIFTYDVVDSLFYSVRNGKNKPHVEFDKETVSTKALNLSTSFGKSFLEISRFDRINRLDVEIKF